MYLYYGRKPECSEKALACTGRASKLQTERSLLGLEQGPIRCDVRALTTVPPVADLPNQSITASMLLTHSVPVEITQKKERWESFP